MTTKLEHWSYDFFPTQLNPQMFSKPNGLELGTSIATYKVLLWPFVKDREDAARGKRRGASWFSTVPSRTNQFGGGYINAIRFKRKNLDYRDIIREEGCHLTLCSGLMELNIC